MELDLSKGAVVIDAALAPILEALRDKLDRANQNLTALEQARARARVLYVDNVIAALG